MIFGDEMVIIPRQLRPDLSDLVSKSVLLAALALFEVFSDEHRVSTKIFSIFDVRKAPVDPWTPILGKSEYGSQVRIMAPLI